MSEAMGCLRWWSRRRTSADPTIMSHESLRDLVSLLRASGLQIPVANLLAFVEAEEILGSDLHSIHRAGRATLTKSPQDIELYDHVFRQWILGAEVPTGHDMTAPEISMAPDAEDGVEDDLPEKSEAETSDPLALRFSRTETIRSMDFAALDEEERSESDRMIAEMRFVASRRMTRRRKPTNRSAGDLDLRRTVRDSMRTGGEPVRLRNSRKRTVPRKVVLLADISGSMSDYSRSLLRFAHAAITARANIEAFTLGTRLTRVTRELTTRDPDQALRRASESVEDWSGGTRLGEGLRAFNDEWGSKGMARGAIIVILSDGWDRGAIEELSAQMQRLSRIAYRVVWVNPLKASDGYAPLARGMAAALPFIDDFIEGHSLDALDRLSGIIADDRSGPVRFTGHVEEVSR